MFPAISSMAFKSNALCTWTLVQSKRLVPTCKPGTIAKVAFRPSRKRKPTSEICTANSLRFTPPTRAIVLHTIRILLLVFPIGRSCYIGGHSHFSLERRVHSFSPSFGIPRRQDVHADINPHVRTEDSTLLQNTAALPPYPQTGTGIGSFQNHSVPFRQLRPGELRPARP